MTTGFLYDERFLDHDAGGGHPERKERLLCAIDHLRAQDWFPRLEALEAVPADRRWVEAVHTHEYIDRAAQACAQGAPYLDVADVGISRESHDVAMLAAGAAITLADQVASGAVNNAFCLSRPPGHHAEESMALGFCLYNNVAIAARYLQQAHGLDKVAILDWDVHHGNGTQHTFERDPSVLYVSTHQYPYYPGTGAASETGEGPGAGATVNCPMAAGSDDVAYERAFIEKVVPAIDAFRPEAIILSAGFDAHVDDPLAQICLSTGFFGWMTLRVLELADRHCAGRVISMLEGGYNVATLPLCIDQHIRVLAGVDNS